MKDKFRTNIKVALPSAIITFIILIIYALMKNGADVGDFQFSIIQALPYFVVLLLSIIGINVFIVLITGIILWVRTAGLKTLLQSDTIEIGVD